MTWGEFLGTLWTNGYCEYRYDGKLRRAKIRKVRVANRIVQIEADWVAEFNHTNNGRWQIIERFKKGNSFLEIPMILYNPQEAGHKGISLLNKKTGKTKMTRFYPPDVLDFNSSLIDGLLNLM